MGRHLNQEILSILPSPFKHIKHPYPLIIGKQGVLRVKGILLGMALLILTLTGPALIAQNINQPYYCELRGSIFIEEYPDRADFLVYEEDSEAFADLLVFETDNSLFADKPGMWYFPEERAFADFTIYFVESKNNADFTVYFTPFESFAGCNN